jgi:DnaJ like chaperone protein
MSIWGRLLGGAAGFALGGPIGAILGVMAGSAFDKKKQRSFNYSQISQDQKQQIFTISFIVLSAKLAKSDGQVTNDEIQAFKDKFNVPKSELSKVGKIFNEAKKDVYGYKQIADQVGQLFNDNNLLLEEMLNNLFYIAASDGHISVNEIELLRSISQSFSFDEKTFQSTVPDDHHYCVHLKMFWEFGSDASWIRTERRRPQNQNIRNRPERWHASSKKSSVLEAAPSPRQDV